PLPSGPTPRSVGRPGPPVGSCQRGASFLSGRPLRGMKRTAAHRAASPLHLILPVGLALALAFTLAARSSSAPPLQLGPIVVADGTAVVNGSVGGYTSGETLTVNGQPVGLDANGHFATTVNLSGTSTPDFGLGGPEGNQS